MSLVQSAATGVADALERELDGPEHEVMTGAVAHVSGHMCDVWSSRKRLKCALSFICLLPLVHSTLNEYYSHTRRRWGTATAVCIA